MCSASSSGGNASGCSGLACRILATVALSFGLFGPASAQWTPVHLDTLSRLFAASMRSDHAVSSYAWTFGTDCGAVQCFGDNPDTTYGLPSFDQRLGRSLPARSIASTGAVVLLMETPPAMRYFGITPYLFTRYYAQLPGNPSQSGTVPVFESMTDTVNALNIGTTGSPTPGDNVHTKLAAFVMTADATTYARVQERLVAIGFPATAINPLYLPVEAVPLQLGTQARRDTFSIVMRLSYPHSSAELTDYAGRAPVRVHYVEPAAPREPEPAPPTTYKLPGTGQSEATTLRQARDQLIDTLLERYGAWGAAISEREVAILQTRNYACARLGFSCNGDNPDAVYTAAFGLQQAIVPAPNDLFLVVGVDHGLEATGTGKATYFSQALHDATNQSGALAVSDVTLRGSGLLAAGIVDIDDPRYALYSRLYAVAFSYTCPVGDPICITIPTSGDGGVAPGTPVSLVGRIYLEPATQTRPLVGELITERAFILEF